MKWVLGAAMFAFAMGLAVTAPIPVATATIDDVALKFLPAETTGIAFIDVAALRNAPLVQTVLQGKDVPLPRPLGDIAKSGFDPQRDIDKVTIAKLSGNDGFAIAQGRINKFQIEQYLRDNGKVPEAYLGQNLYRGGDGAFVLLDNVVLAGQVNAVKKAIDQMQLPGSLPLRSDLRTAMQSIDPGSHVWGIGDNPASTLGAIGAPTANPAVDLLKALRSGTYQMRVDTGIQARATGEFTDAESARNAADLARGAITVARLQVMKQQPDLAPLLDGIQVSNSGTALAVRIDVPAEPLKKLLDFYRPTVETK
jgi:hypothetical protein